VTAKKPTVLSHPDSKVEVQTYEPEPYLSQGWKEQGKAPAPKADPS
jgi:hypothetical protein